MDIRYSANPNDMKRYTTEELRREFHISGLFVDDTVQAVYSHVDRMVVFGCKPVTKAVPLDEGIDVWHNFGTKFILERREIGIFNVGGAGTITCDGTEYRLGHKDCLYVTMGTREVVFRSDDASHPALFYMVSAPAHKPCKTTLLTIAQAKKVPCGSPETSNDRVINQFIHPDVLETCQLSMGLTSLKPGSVWNTMPAHTHERRMEVYFYFDIPEDNVVFHFMGQPQETRHLVMQNYDAVISPSWSIHAGCGTANYTFIWAMGGENKTFTDMDDIKNTELR
ncbi:MAG: 5-dehydro-4-deoxy-D-glucuronate isomerase [Succiniclasticum sp.]|jgi:4-deoxy-L-threo-5-hexosulose-uronate ketol-isomerase